VQEAGEEPVHLASEAAPRLASCTAIKEVPSSSSHATLYSLHPHPLPQRTCGLPVLIDQALPFRAVGGTSLSQTLHCCTDGSKLRLQGGIQRHSHLGCTQCRHSMGQTEHMLVAHQDSSTGKRKRCWASQVHGSYRSCSATAVRLLLAQAAPDGIEFKHLNINMHAVLLCCA
jgi:hypothetical protein